MPFSSESRGNKERETEKSLDSNKNPLDQHVQEVAENNGFGEKLLAAAKPQKYARNEVKREMAEVPRETEVMAIGDLHGNAEILVASLKTLRLISADANMADLSSIHWTGGNKKLVLIGDIMADRGTQSFAIMGILRILRIEANDAGGDVIMLDGNHDDFAYAFLTGNNVADGSSLNAILALSNQAEGILEFIYQFDNPNPKPNKYTNLLQAIIERYKGGTTLQQIGLRILRKMQEDPRGKLLLQQMCQKQLVEYVDDLIYMHTDPTPEIISCLNQADKSLGQRCDEINQIYQAGLRSKLLGEGEVPTEFDDLRRIFLSTENRESNNNYSNVAGKMAGLKEKGANGIVHGHTSLRSNNVFTSTDGVQIVNIDFGAGKTLDPVSMAKRSIFRMQKNGEFKTGIRAGV